VNDEVPNRRESDARDSEPEREKLIAGPWGWLGVEWLEGVTHEAESPVRTRRAFMTKQVRRTRRAGVRGAMVASKPGNSGGAKGSRKMDAR